MFKHKAFTIMALVVVLLLAGSTIALAEEPSAEQEIRGQVTAIRPAANAIVIRTANASSIIVYVNERTRYVIPGVRNPGLGDIAIGDQITATGRWRTRSEFGATLIVVNRPVIRPVELSGKVKAIVAPTFTLETRNGDKVIWTNETTRFTIPSVQNPTLADVKIGDEALVTAVAVSSTVETGIDNTGRLVALSVVIRRPQPRPVELSGKVTAVDTLSSTLTLETRAGAKLIQTDSKTRFVIPGVAHPTLADVNVGDQALVTALAIPVSTGVSEQLIALAVVIQRPQPRPVKVAGEVTAIDLQKKTFNLKTVVGEEKVIQTGERTQFIIPGIKRPALENVKVGDQALVTGVTDPTAADPNRILAQIVAIRRPLPRPAKVKGEVLTIEETNAQMTVQSEDGEKVVKWDANTRFCVPGVEKASSSDIQIGDKIVALGVLNEDGSLQAKIIAIEGCSVPDVSSLMDTEGLEDL